MDYIFFDNVSSTQDFIKDRVIKGKVDSAVMAISQEVGRGRRDRKWYSPSGGLWFSFDVPYTSSLITIKIGVAVREACSEFYACKVLLKWPNDLILEGKKVGGIICEKVKDRVVIGIGINTNVEDIDVENSVSFLDVTSKVIENQDLMRKIIDKFVRFESENIISEFRKHMAFIGEEKFVSAINKNAKIIDISDEGHLIIEDNGEIKNIFVGEILIDNN